MKNIEDIDWPNIYARLNERGFAQLPGILSSTDCGELMKLYPANIYRNVIDMQRHRFGKGEYKYFAYPLPGLVQKLRENFYCKLAPIANEWAKKIGVEMIYPASHEAFISLCRQKNQVRPTPLILRYEQSGFNTLHQDLYGDVYFPFQVVFVLSQTSSDFDGGQLVMTEQLPRAQSKASVMTPDRGDAVIFTTNFRPVQGSRGFYKSKMKHGVSELTRGKRFALGIIFHDAN